MPQFDEVAQNKKLAELHRKEEEELIRVLSGKYGHQYLNLNGIGINTDALRLIDEQTARAAEIAAFDKTGAKLRVAIRNPNSAGTKKVLEELASRGFKAEIFMASTASLEHAWERYEDIKRSTSSQKGVLDIAADEVAQFAAAIKTPQIMAETIQKISTSNDPRTVTEVLEAGIGGALSLHASDIHLEPEEEAVRLRLRLDGMLTDVTDLSSALYDRLRSRIKLLAGFKLNVTDRAQDGRFTIAIGDREIEIRASIIPGAYGESIVMRVLDPDTLALSMDQLGINPTLFAVIEEELAKPNGMIVTTGPTGSGKTTSLYAFLRRIHTPEKKVVTLEDPIEYHLEGIVQTQIGGEYTFATGLRAILRQDPDVIMVGEIRDRDVAETAAHAALTGHLVLSTLHTNNAAGAFPRLIDLGVDSRTIGSAVNLVLAQRLVRRLCATCKKEREPTPDEEALLRATLADVPGAPDLAKPFHVHEPVGCDECGTSGFTGRIGIYEGIRVDSAVESAVIEDSREEHVLAAAAAQKLPNIQQDGLLKVLAGLTSITELSRVIDLRVEKPKE